MFLTAFRGEPDTARKWEASCRDAARERGAMLYARTLTLKNGAALSLGWISKPPIDIDSMFQRNGSRVRVETLAGGGGSLTVDLADGGVVISAPLASPEQIHYARRNSGLFVSNDSRLLLRFLGMELDPAAVYAVLRYGGIPAPLTISRHIGKAPPGRTVTFDPAGNETVAPMVWRPGGPQIGGDTAQAQIQARLAEALPKPGDGPVTLFFSGGVDSAVLAGQLQRDGHADVTFVNYAFDADDPESAIAREMAAHFGYPFVQLLPEDHAIEHVLARVGVEYSYPFGDVSTLPTNTMIHAALDKVPPGSLLVEGTGADGIMGLGSALAVWRRLGAAPAAIQRLGAEGYRQLDLWKYGGPLRKVCWVLRTLSQMPLVDAAVLSQNSLEGIAYRVPEDERRRLAHAIERSYAAPMAGHDFGVRASMTDLMHVCGGIFAAKSFDPLRSAGMRVVYPFLSPQLVELSALLSPDCIYRDGIDKPVLKAMLRQSIPPHLVDRPKHGFEPPMARYLRMPGFRAYLYEVVLSQSNPVLDCVNEKQTRRMIDYSGGHEMKNREVHNYLWALTFLTGWVGAHAHAPMSTT